MRDTKNMLTQALKCKELDDALRVIMDALGIDAGDVAGQQFGQASQEAWRTRGLDHRARMLSGWLHNELIYAVPLEV